MSDATEVDRSQVLTSEPDSSLPSPEDAREQGDHSLELPSFSPIRAEGTHESSLSTLPVAPDFLYSDSVETSVGHGAVIGSTSRGRTTRKPSNFREVAAARNTLADDDLPLFDEPFPTVEAPPPGMPPPAVDLPSSPAFDVHSRQSLLYPSEQRREEAEPVYYFRHSQGTMKDVEKCGQPARYHAALKVEMEKICVEEVVAVEPLPDGETPLDSFVFFKDKFHPDGTYDKTKCRLVVRGDKQEWWQYDETFASSLHAPHFRLFTAICASEGFEPFAVDLKSAFLQVPMKERLYLRIYKWMEPFLPPLARERLATLRSQGQTRLALQMLMTVYGCRQGPNNLQQHVSENFRGYSLKQSVKAPNVWMLHSNDSTNSGIGGKGKPLLVVEVFADDIAIGGVPEERQRFLDHLTQTFQVGTLRPMDSYIGYRVQRDDSTGNIHLSMPDRIVQALDRFHLLHAKAMPTPMPVITRPLKEYVPDEGSEEALQCASLPYAHLIGVLNYLAQTVRPDIAVSVRMLATFTSNPGLYHWKCAKRILRYLKGTRHLGLCYRGGEPLVLTGNSDASHGGNSHDSRTFSGYFTMLAGAPIHWDVHKQSSVPTSTVEAEFVGAYHLAKDVAGFRALLDELGYPQPAPTQLYCDNMGAIQWAYRRGRIDKMKHVRMKYHKVQELVEAKEISLAHLRSADMPADMLTKILPRTSFEHLRAFVMA